MKISLLTPTRNRPHSMQSGIYMILNTGNGHFYIGSTNSFSRRSKKHKTLLTTLKHPNKHLKNAYACYGADLFEFLVLEYVPDELLTIREQEYLNGCYDGGVNCYNQSKDVYSMMRGRKHSKETIAKMSGLNNHRFGKPMLPEIKEKLSALFTGTKRPDVSIRAKRNKYRAKLHDICLLSPKHEKYGPIFDLVEFCAKHNLDQRTMYRLMDGSRKSHKGWKITGVAL